MNEAGLAKLKRSVGRLKTLVDSPELDSWVWNEQLLKSLDDVAYWYNHERHLQEDDLIHFTPGGPVKEEKARFIKQMDDGFELWRRWVRFLDGEI